MLAILVIIFGVVFISSMESYGRSYMEEINYYREEVRHALMEETFNDLADRNERLGMWPENTEQLAALSRFYLKSEDNYLLSDHPRNIHAPYLHYERSAEWNQPYESDRAILITEEREIAQEDSLLHENQNECGDRPFSDGRAWCPPAILSDSQVVFRSGTQQHLSEGIAEQELYVRHLANRVTNYINASTSLPPTPGGTDVPLYRHIRDGSGNPYDPSTPCDSAYQYEWDGIPITCQDMFSVWNVDDDDRASRSTLAGIFGVNGDDRFDVPIRVFRSGPTLTFYVESPFENYGSGAWGATTTKRGENRPSSGSPSYIYTTVRYDPPP